MQEYVIHPLVVGANETDQGVMTYLRGYGKRIWIPIYVFYLRGGRKRSWSTRAWSSSWFPPRWRRVRPEDPGIRGSPGHASA